MGGKEAGNVSPGTGEGAGDRISSSFPASQIQLVLKIQGWKMSNATLVHPPAPGGEGRTTHSYEPHSPKSPGPLESTGGGGGKTGNEQTGTALCLSSPSQPPPPG